MKKIIVTGSASGLGKLIAEKMEAVGFEVIRADREIVDVSSEESVSSFFDFNVDSQIDGVVNCAGINFIDWFEDIESSKWDEVMNTNAKSMFLMTKEAIRTKAFKNPAFILNIVSNASHMPMTNSAAYNASKGAAHILTLQMARELRKRHGITVFGISPNKMHSTKMTEYIDGRVCELRGWTPEQAKEYQMASLPAGEETDPAELADFIQYLLMERDHHKYLNGVILPYGA